jgi:F1F0 ATPase subunit 2
MNWTAAATTGFGVGLAYFGGLWLAVKRLETTGSAAFAAGRLARLGLAAVAFCALLQTGGRPALLAGLAGMLAARWCVIRRVRGGIDGW